MLIHCDISFDENTKEWVLKIDGKEVARSLYRNVIENARKDYVYQAVKVIRKV